MITFFYEGINEICISLSHSIYAPLGDPLLVVCTLCILATPTFTKKLNSEVMEASLVNPTSTVGNGLIQIGPIYGTSLACDQLG